MNKTFMKILITILVFLLGTLKPSFALEAVSLQVHNPSQGPSGSVEPSAIKSQFVMKNDSSAGINISSILWEFASPIFIDSTSASPGFGDFRDYEVSPAQTYGGVGSGEFEISVLANSDILSAYTGPTSFSDGATTLFLTFNDFNPGEAFGFWTDLDATNNGVNSTGRVGNSDFNGSKSKVIFSDGAVLDYTWTLPDNDGRSFYFQGEGSIPPGGNVIPEPTTMLLLSTGGVLGLFFRRKKSAT